MKEGDLVTIRATVRLVLDDGTVAVEIPELPVRVRLRPARRVKVGDVLTLSGEVIAVLDGDRIVVEGDDFGRVTVQEDFAAKA